MLTVTRHDVFPTVTTPKKFTSMLQQLHIPSHRGSFARQRCCGALWYFTVKLVKVLKDRGDVINHSGTSINQAFLEKSKK